LLEDGRTVAVGTGAPDAGGDGVAGVGVVIEVPPLPPQADSHTAVKITAPRTFI